LVCLSLGWSDVPQTDAWQNEAKHTNSGALTFPLKVNWALSTPSTPSSSKEATSFDQQQYNKVSHRLSVTSTPPPALRSSHLQTTPELVFCSTAPSFPPGQAHGDPSSPQQRPSFCPPSHSQLSAPSLGKSQIVFLRLTPLTPTTNGPWRTRSRRTIHSACRHLLSSLPVNMGIILGT